MEGGDGSNQPLPPEDSQLDDLFEWLTENVAEFQKFIDEVFEALDHDENFNEMTAESYEEKNFYMKEQLKQISKIHNSLADHYFDLIDEMNRLHSSDSGCSTQASQIIGPKASTSTSFKAVLHPEGGFYLVENKEPSHSGSESSVPPVNVAALKAKKTKRRRFGGSEAGSEASTSSVNKPTNEELQEKVSSLEKEAESLKQKVQTLTVKNGELKKEIEGHITDIMQYMSDFKPITKAMENELNESKEFAQKTDEQMYKILEEKIGILTTHGAELREMETKMNERVNELLVIENTHEKKEKIWNGITEQLKNDLKQKIELLEEVSNNVEELLKDKSAQEEMIHKLQTELNSLKFENAGLLPPLDNVQRLADEVKLKVEELEREVDRQREAMSDGDRN